MEIVTVPVVLVAQSKLKLASNSAAILYNSMEIMDSLVNSLKVKWSDWRPFILILDSILLVYATSVMWMTLSPYPNLCKAEKIKSTLKILQKNFYSAYLTNQLCH